MRREFSSKTKTAAWERANGQCEACTARLSPGHTHYDHIVPDALGGEPILENVQVLCSACHGRKTAKQDVPRIAKAKRQQRAHIGANSSKKSFPCGKRSKWRKKLNGEVVPR